MLSNIVCICVNKHPQPRIFLTLFIVKFKCLKILTFFTLIISIYSNSNSSDIFITLFCFLQNLHTSKIGVSPQPFFQTLFLCTLKNTTVSYYAKINIFTNEIMQYFFFSNLSKKIGYVKVIPNI